MAKSGRARVLSPEQWTYLFAVIQEHRYPEKNTAIMMISYKLGLRAQEIALLQLKEVCQLGPKHAGGHRTFRLNEIMALPASYTKGSNATGKSTYQRTTVSFKKDEFDKAIFRAVELTKSGLPVNPEDFYPPIRKHKGKSRDLPLVDQDLIDALAAHIEERLQADPSARKSDPLFLTQKRVPYSPNTLQKHMGHMLKSWAVIEKASSHSGRRSLITHLVHDRKLPLSVAQKVAGHVNPSTTVIYTEPTDLEIEEALRELK
jgi:integrase